MYDDFVKRLREKAEAFDYDGWVETAIDYEQAADAIEELIKDRDNWKVTAKEEREMYWHWFDNYQRDVPRWIPVTERLPECDLGAEVGNIEWISCGMVHAGCFGRGGKYRDTYFRTWTDAGEGMDAKDADYWRSVTLPEPLEEHTNV